MHPVQKIPHRPHHVPLERAVTTAVRAGTARRGRVAATLARRARVEEELLVALAAGDRERVSELRGEYDRLVRRA